MKAEWRDVAEKPPHRLQVPNFQPAVMLSFFIKECISCLEIADRGASDEYNTYRSVHALFGRRTWCSDSKNTPQTFSVPIEVLTGFWTIEQQLLAKRINLISAAYAEPNNA